MTAYTDQLGIGLCWVGAGTHSGGDVSGVLSPKRTLDRVVPHAAA
jgi:hypothetical protein